MVQYTPGAECRLVDMNSTTNLNRIDIIVFWKDRFAGLRQFQLQPGCAASIKIMLRGKDFNVARSIFISKGTIYCKKPSNKFQQNMTASEASLQK